MFTINLIEDNTGELTRQALDEGFQAVDVALGPEGVRALVEERNTAQVRVKEVEGQLVEVQNSACLNCNRSLPPDGDCYGCAADMAWAEIAELQSQLAGAISAIETHAALMSEANTRAERQTKRADSYARTAQAVLRDAGPGIVEARERAENAEAQAATLLPVTEASLKYFEAVEKGASLGEQQRLWLLWDCAVIKYRAALAPETKEETNVLR